MTKQEYCESHDSIAYYSALNGFEIKGFEYGINDYLYAVSNAWVGNKKYHKLKINYYGDGRTHVICRGVKVPLNECISM